MTNSSLSRHSVLATVQFEALVEICEDSWVKCCQPEAFREFSLN